MNTEENNKRYQIEANELIMGTYEGKDEQDALNRYAHDAGYKDYKELVLEHGEATAIEIN